LTNSGVASEEQIAEQIDELTIENEALQEELRSIRSNTYKTSNLSHGSDILRETARTLTYRVSASQMLLTVRFWDLIG
jgi:hypothetical protein